MTIKLINRKTNLQLAEFVDTNETVFCDKSLLEYIRKHAVGLLRLREQHTPPRSVIVIVVSLQLMHFLIHAHGGKLAII